MIKVESSNVKAVGYTGTSLFVLFKNGGLYKYNDVPVAQYEQLLVAESVGQYLNKNIKKGGYECIRIWDDDPMYTEKIEEPIVESDCRANQGAGQTEGCAVQIRRFHS